MSERAAYSRVYWSIIDDPRFVSVYDDDRHLATWLRLLLIADQAHPSSPHLPTGCRKASVAALVEAGLIVLGTGYRYRVHGLDAERERRRVAATSRGPSGDRTVSKRGPNGIQTQGLRRDETRQDETKRAGEEVDDGRADLEAFLLVTRRAPTPKQRRLLDELLTHHDVDGPYWAATIMLNHPDDPIGAVIEADKQWREQRIAEARSQEKPTPRPRRARGLPESTRELIAHWEAQKRAEMTS